MTTIKTEMLASNELVEQFVGTAYDKMAALYDQIPTLLALQETLEGFTDRNLGALTAFPTTRTDGSALQDGDTFFHQSLNLSYYYVDGSWVSSNNFTTTVEVQTIAAGNLQGNDTILTLSNPISTISGGTMVFVSQVYQYEITDINTDGAYRIDSATQITFPNSLLQVGEEVVIVSAAQVSNVNPIISITTARYEAESTNQTAIPVPSEISYVPGASNLQVYKEGLLLANTVDYVETSSSQIDLVVPVAAGTTFLFVQGALVATETSPQNDVITLPLISSIPSNLSFLNSNSDKVLVVKGGTTTGDGSGGTYVYDATFSRASANGVTAVDPTVAIGVQGTGSGTGCWMRQYEDFVSAAWFNAASTGIDSLRYISALDGDKAIVKGFYDGTTVGGGIFVWDATRAKEDHDGATVISPLVISTPGTSGWFTAPSSGADGCWIRLEDGNLTSDMFGADPTDAATSEQSFLAMVAVGKPVQVTPGTYTADTAHTGDFYSYGAITINGVGSVTITNLLA